MYQDDPYLKDLLKTNRKPKHTGKLWFGFAAFLFGLVSLGIWLSIEPEEKPVVKETKEEFSFQFTKEMVHQSIQAARLPLTIEKATEESQAPVKKEPIAVWESGKSASLQGALKRNQSVAAALQQRKISSKAIHPISRAMSKVFNFKYSRPGDKWQVEVDEQGEITKFQYIQSPEDIWQVIRNVDGTLLAEKVKVPLDIRQRVATGLVETNLWDALTAAGLSAKVSKRFLHTLTPVMGEAFVSQPGDRFSIVYDEVYLNGQKLRDGRVKAIAYQTDDTLKTAFLKEEEDGRLAYYDQKGRSLEYDFLLKPVSQARLTSKFGPRFHPVLKRMKAHNGVDYAAPTGTPVLAAADGKVVFAGWKGANGKLVGIEHKSGLTTYYAHLSYIPKSMKRGLQVKQRQMIGHIGSTGRSTGPHLHFAVKRNGKWMDPLSIRPRRKVGLKGRAKEIFLTDKVEPLMRTLRIDEGVIRLPP